MTCLVLGHFMYSVMDGIPVLGLSVSGDTVFVLTSSGLCLHTLLKVGLCVPYTVTEQLSKLRCVLCLFPCIALESLCYLYLVMFWQIAI